MTRRRDDATGPGRRGSYASTATEEALVTRLRGLSTELAATPDEEFRAATRARLVAMAAVRAPAAGSTRRPPATAGVLRRLLSSSGGDAAAARRRTRLTAGLAGAALTVTALGGLLGAAQGARPGDLLYDLKRGGEQTQLALAGDSRGTTLLGFASTRLEELDELVGVQPNADAVVGSSRSGGEAGLAAGPDVDLVLDTLQTMDAQTAEGTAALTARAVQESDGAALDLLTGWAADQQSGLGALAGAVPTGAQDALTAARDLVGEVATRGTDLQAALACAGGPSTAGTDELGPVPAACPATPPSSAGPPTPSGEVTTSGPSGTNVPSSPVPLPVPSGASVPSTVPGAPATGTAAPAPTSGAAPTTSAPAAPPGRALPSLPAPAPTSLPGLPLPLPPLPSVPVTVVPPTTATTPVPPVVSVPPLVPGLCVSIPLVKVC